MNDENGRDFEPSSELHCWSHLSAGGLWSEQPCICSARCICTRYITAPSYRVTSDVHVEYAQVSIAERWSWIILWSVQFGPLSRSAERWTVFAWRFEQAMTCLSLHSWPSHVTFRWCVHKLLPFSPAGPTSHHRRLAVNQMFPGHSAWNDKAPGYLYFFHGHHRCFASSREDWKENRFTVDDI